MASLSICPWLRYLCTKFMSYEPYKLLLFVFYVGIPHSLCCMYTVNAEIAFLQCSKYIYILVSLHLLFSVDPGGHKHEVALNSLHSKAVDSRSQTSAGFILVIQFPIENLQSWQDLGKGGISHKNIKNIKNFTWKYCPLALFWYSKLRLQ